MPLDRLSQFHLGAVDGKHEYLETCVENLPFFDTFLMPQTVNEPTLLSGEKFLVRGFRGTGKTSLLRWLAKKHRDSGSAGQFVLFKTDLSESKRMEISRQAGVKWEIVESEKIEMLQDFKEAWRWFLHRKIAEILIDGNACPKLNTEFTKYQKLLGLTDASWFERVIGEFPKVEAAKIRIRAFLDFLEAEFPGDIQTGPPKSISFVSVLNKLDNLLARIPTTKPLYLCLDELEVFYHTDDQYRRDLRMVRDLIFAVSAFSTFVKSRNLPIKLYAAVRSEVLDAIGTEGQEVSRIAQDLGVNIAWHYANRSLNHPLFHMLRRKLWSSEARMGISLSKDPIAQYFPETVAGIPLDVFLLDQSFYKPRDLVLRLKVAQDQFPLHATFDAVVLSKTDIDYSARMWEEVTYELSAMYNADEVRAIENIFLGMRATFELDEVAERLRLQASRSKAADNMMRRRGIRVVLQDLYRLGAIGNSVKVGPTIRQRWIHRGDATLVDTERMSLHASLVKRLSARTRRRVEAEDDSQHTRVPSPPDHRQEELWGKTGLLGGRRLKPRTRGSA